jgi:hypothetical protein
MNDQTSSQGLSGVFIGLGVLLIVLGALFFVGQTVGIDLGHFGWPFFVIIPGLAVFGVGLALGSPTGERITPFLVLRFSFPAAGAHNHDRHRKPLPRTVPGDRVERHRPKGGSGGGDPSPVGTPPQYDAV